MLIWQDPEGEKPLYACFLLSATPMAFHRPPKPKTKPRSAILLLSLGIAAIALLFVFSSLVSTNGFSLSSSGTQEIFVKPNQGNRRTGHEKYLYWGNRIDCPGKHCESCEGLGHQESSLRCALEEAMFLQRYVCESLGSWVCLVFCVLLLGLGYV